jgi:DNA-binding transcriptional ArsR family regulator
MDVRSITRIAALIGEPARIRMLAALLDGEGHSASELAIAAEVSPQTASSHLAKLMGGGLIQSERHGRQRHFWLKNTDVATVIESLGALAPLAAVAAIPELRFARTCYDHLAGVLSIGIRDEMFRRDLLDKGQSGEFMVTDRGERFLRRFEIDVSQLRGVRRSFARTCLDWTERHHHVGGALGAALLSRFFEMKWIARVRNSRAVRITHEGDRQFERMFGVRCAALRSSKAVAR